MSAAAAAAAESLSRPKDGIIQHIENMLLREQASASNCIFRDAQGVLQFRVTWAAKVIEGTHKHAELGDATERKVQRALAYMRSPAAVAGASADRVFFDANKGFSNLGGIVVLAKKYLKGCIPRMLNEARHKNALVQCVEGNRPAAASAVAAAPDNRDPQLKAFEDYLLKNLKKDDIMYDCHGKYLFNINRVAYLVEGSTTKDQQRTTLKRIKETMATIQHELHKCQRSGKCEFTVVKLVKQLLLCTWY